MPGEMPPGMGGEAEIDDVDKAGAVYDAVFAGDDEVWRTSKGGKHFQIDTETGEIVKGNLGQKAEGGYQSRPLESTKPDTARYEALLREQKGDHQKAAHEYFREKLQGRHVEAQTDDGPIEAVFTGGTWQELKRDMRKDSLKASLVPHMPDIIASGAYRKNEVYKERNDGATAFHEYRKQVKTSYGSKEAIVDVMEKRGETPSHVVYNLTREGSKNYEDRKKKTPTADSGPFLRAFGAQDSNAVVEDNIAPFFEVVNVRFAGER